MSCMKPYKHLKQFSSTKEMNEYIKRVKKNFANDLNQTARMVLHFMSQYSIKVTGVSKLKVKTIAKGIKKSESSVRKATRLLEKLEIIKKEFTTREKSGGDGANVYIIVNVDRANDRATTR